MSAVDIPSFKYFKISFVAEYVAHVEINRPSKFNAFNEEMWVELKAAFDFLNYRPDVRVILFSGAGEKAFTAGLDVAAAADPSSSLMNTNFPDAARRMTDIRRHLTGLQDSVSTIARNEKPVICLIHGVAYGLGIDLSTACDIRLCTPDTRFCVKEVDVGLAADVGTLSRLPKVIGGLTSWVKDICLTARPFGAQEAADNKLVSRIVPGGKKELHAEGLKLAQLLASKSPVAVQGTKNILDAAWGRTVEDNLNYTAVWNAGMIQTNDIATAMKSAVQKKTPVFAKL